MGRLIRALQRRVRLRTRLRRLPQVWRRALPRRLPPWPHPPEVGAVPPQAVDDDRVPLVADARAANPAGRQEYGPRLPTGEWRVTGGAWEVARISDGTTVVAGRVGAPLDDRQRAVLHHLGLLSLSRRSRRSPARYAGIEAEQVLDRRERAVLVQLAMTGVVLHLPDGAAPPDPLGDILRAPLPGDDPLEWEIRSVQQRREAMRRHAAGLAPPPVTALLVTRRPHLAVAQVAALAAQTYPDLQIVVGVHGDAAPPELAHAAAGRPVEVATIPAERTLGEALAAACETAAGELVTKVDDDDRYGPEHVWDLVLARHYSGATVVGKGSEFVHVAPKNVTVRRRMAAEAVTDTVAGGTVTIGRADLAAAGGWPPVPRHVDRALLDRVLAAGGTVYRTHPFGFVYTRHGDGHTWQADLDHFLHDPRRRWRGTLGYHEFGTG